MRIRYVLLNAYGTGGTVRTVINQANALCDEHDVEIASVYRARAEPRFRVDPRVRLTALTDQRTAGRSLTTVTGALRNPFPHRLDYRFRRWDPALDLRLVRYFRAADEGALVTTRPGLSLLAARTAPRRLIRVAQDHRSADWYHPAVRAGLLRAYRRFDAVTVLTARDLAAYRPALAGSGTRLELIPNGVPPTGMAPAALTAPVLVAAGRLQPEKGFDLLLDAFATVAGKHPDWRLWIFGAGPLKADLATRIERLELAGRAMLKGTTRRLDQQLAKASGFVLSSRHEGLPMVLLEAMAAGLPVVAFDTVSGAAETITHGHNGLLVPGMDVAGLAASICELIEDPRRRKAIGAAARADSDRYAMATVRQRWLDLFADLAGARAGTAAG